MGFEIACGGGGSDLLAFAVGEVVNKQTSTPRYFRRWAAVAGKLGGDIVEPKGRVDDDGGGKFGEAKRSD
jgi:hypothetical protein